MKTPRPYFSNPQDYVRPRTPDESPFRKFLVSCLRCKNVRLKAVVQNDEETGETSLYLYCPHCQTGEKLTAR